MYKLSPGNCQPSVQVRTDKVTPGTGSGRSGPPGSRTDELIVEATVKLGLHPKEHTLQLFVVMGDTSCYVVSDEFVWRPVELSAYCQNDHANPWAQDDDIVLKSIWFGDTVALVLDGTTTRD